MWYDGTGQDRRGCDTVWQDRIEEDMICCDMTGQDRRRYDTMWQDRTGLKRLREDNKKVEKELEELEKQEKKDEVDNNYNWLWSDRWNK